MFNATAIGSILDEYSDLTKIDIEYVGIWEISANWNKYNTEIIKYIGRVVEWQEQEA